MKRDSFITSYRLLVLLAVMLMLTTACIQTQPPATGLQIEGQWARAAKLISAEAMQAPTTMMTATMTTAMTATTAMSSTPAMTGPMTGTMAAEAGTAMTGTMGMGVGGAMSAIYMTIRNPGDQGDRLIKAESDAANVVELHNVAEKNGAMAMFPVEAVEVPAQGEAVLKPGSFHIMLIDLTRDLNVGDTVTVTLTFEQAGPLTVTAEVRER